MYPAETNPLEMNPLETKPYAKMRCDVASRLETNQLGLNLLTDAAARKPYHLDGVLCRVDEDVGVAEETARWVPLFRSLAQENGPAN